MKSQFLDHQVRLSPRLITIFYTNFECSIPVTSIKYVAGFNPSIFAGSRFLKQVAQGHPEGVATSGIAF